MFSSASGLIMFGVLFSRVGSRSRGFEVSCRRGGSKFERERLIGIWSSGVVVERMRAVSVGSEWVSCPIWALVMGLGERVRAR